LSWEGFADPPKLISIKLMLEEAILRRIGPEGLIMDLLQTRSCFVVTPPGMRVNAFLEILRANNFEPFLISDFLAAGLKSSAKVRQAFKSVDFVICLLFADRQPDNQLFELGIAYGLARRTIIFADLNASIPSAISTLKVERVSFEDFGSLIPFIKRFMEPKPSSGFDFRPVPERMSRAIREPIPKRQALQIALDALRATNETAQTSPSQLFERQVTDVLSRSGLTVVEARSRRLDSSPTVDLALWIDELQREIGNPIAVSIKSNLTPAGLQKAIEALTLSLSFVGAKAGVVIYAGKSATVGERIAQRSPLIYVFSIDELLSLLEAGTFVSELRAAYEAVHRPPSSTTTKRFKSWSQSHARPSKNTLLIVMLRRLLMKKVSYWRNLSRIYLPRCQGWSFSKPML
jgi:hypothetical protein